MRLRKQFCAVVLSALVLAGGVCVLSAVPAHSAGLGQASQSATSSQSQAAPAAKPSAPASRKPAWQGTQVNRLSRKAEMYYEGTWGVGELQVKLAESGQMVRFNYRVLDPAKAVALNDKKAEPALLDPQAGVKLSVPQMEKIGKLRQSSTPKAGMVYWMAFANPTLVVKRGHKVDVVIGSFRANNLVVE